MRRQAISVDEIKHNITNLKGLCLKISVNKGRKKIVRYDGKIIDLFPSVFTFKEQDKGDVMSFSYSDVICGDIKLQKL